MGSKEIIIETFIINKDTNEIGVIIKDINGNTKEIIKDDRGNHIALTLDTLLKKRLPIGTQVTLNIEPKVDYSHVYRLVDGDLLDADTDIIAHQVNCKGVMGSGVAKAIKNKHPEVYNAYKNTVESHNYYSVSPLGKIKAVDVNPGLDKKYKKVVNMFSQDGYGYGGKQYTDIDALKKCLEEINNNFSGQSVAFPWLVGCVRGGANWDEVLPLICNTLTDVKEIVFYKL